MDLRFANATLRTLDQAGTEVLVACLAMGERPPGGVAGLVDWRLAGRVSNLIQAGFATGELGEVLMIPGKPRLPFDKILLFGLGPPADFDEAAFDRVTQKMLDTLEGLRIRTAVVELPGRHLALITPERAVAILLESAGQRQEHDVWTLVDDPESQREVRKQLIQQRRRAAPYG